MIKNFQFLKGKKLYKCVCNKEVSIFISKAVVININSDEKIKTTIQTVISSNTKQEGNSSSIQYYICNTYQVVCNTY